MGGIAAVAICAAFTSCSKSNELFDQNAAEQIKQQTSEQKILDSYQKAFENAFGQPGANQDWGLAKYGSVTNAGTRTITVNGDAYDKFPSADDVAANFPTAIPDDAKTDAELEAEWKGKNAVDENGEEIIAWGNKVTMWDMYAIYLNMVGKVINNIKVTTPGEYSVGHTWANPADRVYNVYINVGNGNDLTLKRNGAEHVNFYIMSGNVTIDSNFGECGGIISVAEGATVNDQRSHIAHNDGIKIYNKGTYNAQGSATIYNQELGKSVTSFDIGNHCTFYNEGKFTSVSELSYSPGDANTSYFMNLGDDAELTAPAMTLNSAGNFFNSGKVTITNETYVTQKEIYWVNAGYYKTGSIVFSAKNATFYNYCQLIVTGNAHMYDGEFNLMNNSYTEAATADFDNFIVNMGDNSGFNINGNTNWAAQGDGTYQGFRTTTGANNVYVRLGGTTTVAGHLHSLELTGNITYAINKIVDLGEGNSGVQPTYVFNAGTTEAPFDQLTVTPKEFGQGCGATWNIPPVIVYKGRIMGEDLTAETDNDFDFNDVVFDWAISADKKTAYIRLRAAGGTLPLKIGTAVGQGEEVHELFGVSTSTMVNTGVGANGITKEPVEFTITKTTGTFNNAADIIVSVDKTSKGAEGYMQMTSRIGEAPCLLFVPLNTKWVDEYENIEKAYTWFGEFVGNPQKENWGSAPVEKFVDLDLSNNK